MIRKGNSAMNYSVVFICDDKYVMPTVVAMTSLAKNVKENDECLIYVICDSVSDDNKDRLRFIQKKNVRIKIIDVDSNQFKGLEKSYLKVSKAALLKFEIPNLVKEDKALYLDGDVLVVSDISEIFNTDIGNVYAGVVKDGPKTKVAGGKKHYYHGEENYFNSGVMLLNLRRMREHNIPKKLLDFRLTEYNYFMDQDAFNRVLGKEVVYMSLFYDFMLHLVSYINELYTTEQISEFYGVGDFSTTDELFENVKIYHYTFDKPWKYYDIPMNEIWMNYYKQSSYKDIKLIRNSSMTRLFNSKTYKVGEKISRIYRLLKK